MRSSGLSGYPGALIPDKKTLTEKIEVMQGFAEGNAAAIFNIDRRVWQTIAAPEWNWEVSNYDLAYKVIKGIEKVGLETHKKESDFNVQSVDAVVWAREFCRLNCASSEDTMIGWFANAIMAGVDDTRGKIRKQIEELHL